MLSRRITAARPLSRALQSTAPRTTIVSQIRRASSDHGDLSVGDPNMNGGYINPVPQKRSLRDPYGDWWDKQERRNYGEPVHEDNDILGVFSTEPYTHYQPGFGAVLLGTFVASVFGLCAVVYQFYPDKASVPKTYPDGLEAELGGKGAWLARTDEKDF
ncbi:hypothetical protein AAFC00_000709 [Neodothiora populina]|uniref:NADH:ubiquinone oxidoreductase 20.1kD subunit n=1 Tax=Neodothiora populina TaxID=2781224 RepID=A0ABR3PDR4_9PEZI